MKGRKHASSFSPGGTSFSNPIHERGQLFRIAAVGGSIGELDAARWRRGLTLEVFAFVMELLTILNHCHRHRGFVYQHARFGPDKRKASGVDIRPREGSAAICSGLHTSQRRVTTIFLSGASNSFPSGGFWFFSGTGCAESIVATAGSWWRRFPGVMASIS